MPAHIGDIRSQPDFRWEQWFIYSHSGNIMTGEQIMHFLGEPCLIPVLKCKSNIQRQYFQESFYSFFSKFHSGWKLDEDAGKLFCFLQRFHEFAESSQVILH